MSESKKQEKDYTKEADVLIPEAQKLAESGKYQDAVEKLLVLEKQARNAADPATITRVLSAIINILYKAKDYDSLNANITALSKKHGQLKEPVKAMVEEAAAWLENVKATAGQDRWLELLQTLRAVTEGKVHLETPRARLTLILSKFHENLYNTNKPFTPKATEEIPTPKTLTPRDSLITASDLLSELQVETYSSMDRKEKTEFILEQMRLLVAVARTKDAEGKELKAKGATEKDGQKVATLDGDTEWIKVRVGGRRVPEAFLAEEGNEALKFKYYDLMIQHALHAAAYLDTAQYYYKVWETPSIKADETGKGREALENVIYYVVLAPQTNDQSDMLNRLYLNSALEKLELQYNLAKCFVTKELMRWPGIQHIYGATLRKTKVFGNDEDGNKRWEDLHTRVIEHNVRVISQYYTRVTIQRLTSLLDLSVQQVEEVLSRLVVDGSVYAKIDRPTGVVNFQSRKSAEDVMNEWSSDVTKLMGLVEKSWMGMNAALAGRAAR
ncbi:PCI-domain-containing protein [Clavulina sp. PMI_390]|nr:PCI-domain-containing protein [Clavulina sp. PMI_390]